ncbi:hypothetical protein BKI52_37125 [marine bacterium AO1-C]|nr:hypothetical protein BKI52_37125 [marine bacterium AO1-C]
MLYNLNHKVLLFTICLCSVFTITGLAQQKLSERIQIPNERPRIWFNQEMLDKAKAKYDSGDTFVPTGYGTSAADISSLHYRSEAPFELALHYLLTGDKSSARTAIEWVKYKMTEVLNESNGNSVSCNSCRWYGEQFIIVYDWCHGEFTAQERSDYITNMNFILDRWNNETRWGTPDFPQNNYNQGYLRNNILYAIAAYGDDPKAAGYLEHGVDVRLTKLLEYYKDVNDSGISPQGNDYAHYAVGYLLPVLGTLKNMGLDIMQETVFFKRAVFFQIYNTTPTKAYGLREAPGDDNYSYRSYSYGDANNWQEHAYKFRNSITTDIRGFMMFATMYWEGTTIAKYARAWLNKTNESRDYPPKYVAYLYDPTGPTLDLKDLPRDFIPPGGSKSTLYSLSTNDWEGDDMMVVFQQTNNHGLRGHAHLDAGSFQIWRKGRTVLPEAAGRGKGSTLGKIPNYENNDDANVDLSIAHNVMLFGGEGQAIQMNESKLLRLQSDSLFFYTTVDLTGNYKSQNDNIRYYNEHVSSFIRETIFVKSLDAFIVFDGVQSTHGNDPRKTWITRLMGTPQRNGKTHSATHFGQTVNVTTLLPENPQVTVISEDTYSEYFQYMHRIQIESAKEEKEYFLHVIQAKDEGAADLDIRFTETDEEIIVYLQHPEKGYATVLLKKDQAKGGSAFAFAPNNAPEQLQTLPDSIQLREITTINGFKWLNLDGTGATVEPPPTPTNSVSSSNEFRPFNIVTPNNDGRNDYWQIDGLPLEHQIKVFNRAGQVVFKSDNYTVTGPWDGTNKGKLLPAGIYYYNIITNNRGLKESKSGFITLIR